MDRKAKTWVYRIIAFVLGIGVLLILIYHAGVEQFLEAILETSPYWIAASVVVYAASWIPRTWRLQQLTIHAGKNIQIFDVFKLHISGYALNAILPAKLGDAATIGYLKMQGISIGRSAAIVLQTRILDLLALILLSIPAVLFLLGKGTPYWMVTTLVFCTLIVAVPIAIVAADKAKRFSAMAESWQNRSRQRFLKLVVEKTKDAYEGYHDIVSDKRLFIVSIFLSLAIWLIDGLTAYVVSIAVGAKVSIMAIILAVSIANVGKTIPATPGSLGIYESILTAVLVMFGVPLDMAVVIAILEHTIKKLFNLALGIPATMALGLSFTQIYEMTGDKEA